MSTIYVKMVNSCLTGYLFQQQMIGRKQGKLLQKWEDGTIKLDLVSDSQRIRKPHGDSTRLCETIYLPFV